MATSLLLLLHLYSMLVHPNQASRSSLQSKIRRLTSLFRCTFFLRTGRGRKLYISQAQPLQRQVKESPNSLREMEACMRDRGVGHRRMVLPSERRP